MRRSEHEVAIKRAYEPPAAGDGYRVLVDRVWPRGVSKAEARIDEWAKELAPTTELRKWFGHDPERFDEFRTRYLRELEGQRERIEELRRHGKVTLVFGARDTERNNAVVLADLVRRRS